MIIHQEASIKSHEQTLKEAHQVKLNLAYKFGIQELALITKVFLMSLTARVTIIIERRVNASNRSESSERQLPIKRLLVANKTLVFY